MQIGLFGRRVEEALQKQNISCKVECVSDSRLLVAIEHGGDVPRAKEICGKVKEDNRVDHHIIFGELTVCLLGGDNPFDSHHLLGM